ncbi:MAG: flagellar hook-associated protein FlgK [bacterium]
MSTTYNSSQLPTSLSGIMMMARDALLAQQAAMNVLSHNVSNVNTEGFHRQRVTLSTRTPMEGYGGQWGQGVDIQQVERSYHSFITRQERTEAGTLGRWETERDLMMRVEELVGGLSDYGIGNAMTQFWNSWEDLANDADSVTARLNVIGRANDLGTAFHDTYLDLDNVRKEVNVEMMSQIDTINNYAQRIAALNEQIYTVTGRSQNPNDLMDQRDQLVKELGQMANITIEEEKNGSMTIYLGNETLVFRNEYRTLDWKVDTTGSTGPSGGNVIWSDDQRQVQLYSGKLYGSLQVRDYTTGLLSKLDNLANTLRDEVNSMHSDGIGLDGSTGNNFFNTDVRGALSLHVNSDLANNPQKVSVSTVSATGDNSLAHSIFNLQFENAFDEGQSNYNDYYQQLVIDLGNRIDNANTRADASAASMEQTESWQQQYTGVNLDEEMANMVTVQYAFTAASKVTTAVDEMIQTLLAAV